MAQLTKVQRNRVLALVVLIFISVGLYAVQFHGYYDIVGTLEGIVQPSQQAACTTCGQGLTAGDIIEASTASMDVLGYAVGASATGGDTTPTIWISGIYYGMTKAKMPRHVVLTDGGYERVEKELDWSPTKVQDPNTWSYEKYWYYDENGMFTPEPKARVLKALDETYDQYTDELVRDLLYGVFLAAHEETAPWNRIVLEFLFPLPRQQLMGNGAVNLEVDLYVQTRLFIFKKGQRVATVDGEEVTAQWQPHMAVPAQGELTQEDWEHLEESGQMSVDPMLFFFGPQPYQGVINHPWQGRELQ
jgi:hypothetical protein